MHKPLTAVVAAIAIAAGCGGRTGLGGASTPSDASAESGPSGPCEIDGVRLCGGSCPALDNSQCPGRGCTTPQDSSVGICWSDMSDGEGTDACNACRDGDACVQRDATDLVCAPFDLCAGLAARGNASACRYADKSPFSGSSLLSPGSTCPVDKPGTLCGGACGDCPSWTLQRCTGRSASRPFGVCPRVIVENTFDPADVAACSVDTSGNAVVACPVPEMYDPPKGKPEPAVCMVFAGGDEHDARAYGLCMPKSDCQTINTGLPGGVHCFLDGADVR